MEWMKNQSLRKSFFSISALFLCAGILLAALSFFLCVELSGNYVREPQYQIIVNEAGELVAEGSKTAEQSGQSPIAQNLLTVAQLILPIFWVTLSVILADIVFYNRKLKRPIAALQSSALRIQKQDLDFSIEPFSQDELGQLLTSFELMRQALKSNHQELWRQMEERKRLNAAFAHDLRNPITVLKGSAKMLQKGLEQSPVPTQNMRESVSLIAQYTDRIETYMDSMTSVQKLEELECKPVLCDWQSLRLDIERILPILSEGSQKKLHISCSGERPQALVDKQFFYNVAENLTSNALRYACEIVTVQLSCGDDQMILTIADDGPGFPSNLLQKGPSPFWRNDIASGEHFGMGLYICKLLCEKHGGRLILENPTIGAKATAIMKI